MLQIPIAAFVVCAAAMTLLNCLLARWKRTVLQMSLANLVLAALCVSILLSALGNASGLFVYVACALLFLYPALRSLYLSHHPPTTNTMMTYSQAAFFGIGCFLLLQHNGTFHPGWGLNVLCFVSQGLNLALLSYLRSEGRNSKSGYAGGRERWFILPFYVGLILILSIVLAFFILPQTRETLINILDLIKNIFNSIKNALLWVLDYLFRFLEYLLSFLAGNPSEPPIIEGTGLSSMLSPVGRREVNYLLLAMLSLVGVTVLAWAIYRFRKARLRFGLYSSNVKQITVASAQFWSFVRKMLSRLSNRLHFYSLLLIHFRQPAGVFAQLERKGRLCGCPRLPGQTPREFLEMLSSRTAPEEADARDALSGLAERLDILCFQADRNAISKPCSPHKVSANEVRTMLRAIRKRTQMTRIKGDVR
jgi:uncharacterized membrane protein YqhA